MVCTSKYDDYMNTIQGGTWYFTCPFANNVKLTPNSPHVRPKLQWRGFHGNFCITYDLRVFSVFHPVINPVQWNSTRGHERNKSQVCKTRGSVFPASTVLNETYVPCGWIGKRSRHAQGSLELQVDRIYACQHMAKASQGYATTGISGST